MHSSIRRIKVDDNPSVPTLHLQLSGLFVNFRCCSGSQVLTSERQVSASAAEQKMSSESCLKLLAHSSNPSLKQGLSFRIFVLFASPMLGGPITIVTFSD